MGGSAALLRGTFPLQCQGNLASSFRKMGFPISKLPPRRFRFAQVRHADICRGRYAKPRPGGSRRGSGIAPAAVGKPGLGRKRRPSGSLSRRTPPWSRRREAEEIEEGAAQGIRIGRELRLRSKSRLGAGWHLLGHSRHQPLRQVLRRH